MATGDADCNQRRKNWRRPGCDQSAAARYQQRCSRDYRAAGKLVECCGQRNSQSRVRRDSCLEANYISSWQYFREAGGFRVSAADGAASAAVVAQWVWQAGAIYIESELLVSQRRI